MLCPPRHLHRKQPTIKVLSRFLLLYRTTQGFFHVIGVSSRLRRPVPARLCSLKQPGEADKTWMNRVMPASSGLSCLLKRVTGCDLLFDDHCQVHAWMYRAIVVEGSAHREGAKRARIIAVKRRVIGGSAILFGRIRSAIFP